MRYAVPSVDSPHTRGWTPTRMRVMFPGSGFPAHAGMDPGHQARHERGLRIPRTRGDGPADRPDAPGAPRDSPHTRGWTREPLRPRAPGDGFPAHAGMDPAPTSAAGATGWIPRTRGDGPARGRPATWRDEDSPHTRGWTRHSHPHVWGPHGFPAHAGMDPCGRNCARPAQRIPRTRGDGPPLLSTRPGLAKDSPHTRGWTRGVRGHRAGARGFPAHAGMDPCVIRPSPGGSWIPRTRGDGPGLITLTDVGAADSPHTRGWTPHHRARLRFPHGFPAHAGMDRTHRSPAFVTGWIPRTRGDGPGLVDPGDVFLQDSPHTRGWTLPARSRPRPRPGFPAHAGMDLDESTTVVELWRIPRTRGDGPADLYRHRARQADSPHTRGWTRGGESAHALRGGFPAHAGMDPA